MTCILNEFCREFSGKAPKRAIAAFEVRHWMSERKIVKRKPDMLLILMAVFGMGVVATLLIPMTSNDSVAAPASELQAGVIIKR